MINENCWLLVGSLLRIGRRKNIFPFPQMEVQTRILSGSSLTNILNEVTSRINYNHHVWSHAWYLHHWSFHHESCNLKFTPFTLCAHATFRPIFIFLCLDMLSYNDPVFATNFSSSLRTCDTMKIFNGKWASSNRSIVTDTILEDYIDLEHTSYAFEINSHH